MTTIMQRRCLHLIIGLLSLVALAQADVADTALQAIDHELARLLSELEALQSALGYAPLWDARGLISQPRLAELMRRQGLEHPPTTPWQALPLGELAERRWEDPAAALAELTLQQGLGEAAWELTQRLLREGERALGALLVWGLKDDAVIGQDYRAEWVREAEGWRLVQLERRQHCLRGLNDAGGCR